MLNTVLLLNIVRTIYMAMFIKSCGLRLHNKTRTDVRIISKTRDYLLKNQYQIRQSSMKICLEAGFFKHCACSKNSNHYYLKEIFVFPMYTWNNNFVFDAHVQLEKSLRVCVVGVGGFVVLLSNWFIHYISLTD